MADENAPDIHTFRFLALIDSLRHAATVFLAEAVSPAEAEGEGGPEREREGLEKARHYIDFLATLEVKTRGNLSGPEEIYLKELLSALRMDFVDAAEKTGKGGSESPERETGGGEAGGGEESPGEGGR